MYFSFRDSLPVHIGWMMMMIDDLPRGKEGIVDLATLAS
jgi:hypothetical protein